MCLHCTCFIHRLKYERLYFDTARCRVFAFLLCAATVLLRNPLLDAPMTEFLIFFFLISNFLKYFGRFCFNILTSTFQLQHTERQPDCSNVTCDGPELAACPPDSKPWVYMHEPGLCCPRTRRCFCKNEECPVPQQCGADQRRLLIQKGDGQPGSCCDRYECRGKGQRLTKIFKKIAIFFRFIKSLK